MTTFVATQSASADTTRAPGERLDRTVNLIGVLALLPGLLVGVGMFVLQSL